MDKDLDLNADEAYKEYVKNCKKKGLPVLSAKAIAKKIYLEYTADGSEQRFSKLRNGKARTKKGTMVSVQEVRRMRKELGVDANFLFSI